MLRARAVRALLVVRSSESGNDFPNEGPRVQDASSLSQDSPRVAVPSGPLPPTPPPRSPHRAMSSPSRPNDRSLPAPFVACVMWVEGHDDAFAGTAEATEGEENEKKLKEE